MDKINAASATSSFNCKHAMTDKEHQQSNSVIQKLARDVYGAMA